MRYFAIALLLTVACRSADKNVSSQQTVGDSAGQVNPATLEYKDLITVEDPHRGQIVSSPLAVHGKARGTWYSEGSFPVILLDAAGDTLATKPAAANGEWMTENYVPFLAVLTFATTADSGTLVLKKDNPSGEPLRDDEVRLPIRFH
jgi:Immunoglobulin-like domain of bacterial spore germination